MQGTERSPFELLPIPGPVSVDDEVLEVLGQPVMAHHGDAWTELYLALTEQHVEGVR